MHISSTFDAGNIEVVGTRKFSARLRIRPDVGGQHMQWFYFRVSGARSQRITLRIENAGKASYPQAWSGYQARVSTDRVDWRQVPRTSYADGVLIIELEEDADLYWVAYFAPYSAERHAEILVACAEQGATVEVLGPTLDGRDLDLLTAGTGPLAVWLIARQHPGESMAEYFMEGLLERLLDSDDAHAERLLSLATFYIVPNMNPDGASRGHLRCNAAGANLNREWHAPTMARSPEVKLVRDAMDERGCDLCLDVHGDEELPYNFIAAAEGIPGWTTRLADLTRRFCDALEAANPDFQQEHGYPVDPPGEANMSMATSQVAQRFDCLAMTLEMPFKDNAARPDPELGWSPARAMKLGASTIDALVAVVDILR